MSGWVSLGPADVDGKQAHMWQLKEMQGEKVNTYTFYVAEVRTAILLHSVGQVTPGDCTTCGDVTCEFHTPPTSFCLATAQEGTPIKFYSVGQDYFGGSHYDEYIYEWTSFKPGPVDPAVFAVPDICNKKTQQQQQQQQQRHHISMQAVSLLPGNHQELKGKPQLQLLLARELQALQNCWHSCVVHVFLLCCSVCRSSCSTHRIAVTLAFSNSSTQKLFPPSARQEFECRVFALTYLTYLPPQMRRTITAGPTSTAASTVLRGPDNPSYLQRLTIFKQCSPWLPRTHCIAVTLVFSDSFAHLLSFHQPPNGVFECCVSAPTHHTPQMRPTITAGPTFTAASTLIPPATCSASPPFLCRACLCFSALSAAAPHIALLSRLLSRYSTSLALFPPTTTNHQMKF
jgi:hypothetical protein